VVYSDSERNFIRSSIHAAAVFGASVGVFCVNGDFLRDVGCERVRGSSGLARVSLCLPFSVQCVFVHIFDVVFLDASVGLIVCSCDYVRYLCRTNSFLAEHRAGQDSHVSARHLAKWYRPRRV